MDWTKVWEAVDGRRVDLGWSLTKLYEETGVSEATFRKMSKGEPLTRADKRASVTNALGWTAGSIDAVLGGGTPTIRRSMTDGDFSLLVDQVDRLALEVEHLRREVAVLQRRRSRSAP